MSLPAILTASAALENANLAALGITHAFDTPPETLAGCQLPVSVRFAEPTRQLHGSRLMGRYNLYEFKIEVHWARGFLPEAVAQCFGSIEAFQDLYTANLTIGGSCNVSGFREPACTGPVALKYAATEPETLGFIFYFWAKEILDDLWVDLGGAPPPVPAVLALLLQTGQTSCYAVGCDGDYEAGVAKGYTVDAVPATSDIEVAHYANNGISFVAPNTVNDAGAGLVTFLNTDRIRIKGSALNDGEYNVLAGGVPGAFTTVENTIVNEGAGAVVSLYKVAALSNNVVQDDRTTLMWARYTSNGLRVGAASTGTLNWRDVATDCTLYNAANTISVIMPGNIFRITGGAALTQFHVGDCIMAAGFANAVNLLPFYRILSVTVNGADLDIVVQPQQNDPMVAEGAVGDTLYLNCRSIYNYAAGANVAGLGGYSDWRNPADEELRTLAVQEAPNALPDGVAFPGWSFAAHWSSTTAPNNTPFALPVSFSNANTTSTAKTSALLAPLVRLGI